VTVAIVCLLIAACTLLGFWTLGRSTGFLPEPGVLKEQEAKARRERAQLETMKATDIWADKYWGEGPPASLGDYLIASTETTSRRWTPFGGAKRKETSRNSRERRSPGARIGRDNPPVPPPRTGSVDLGAAAPSRGA
jgi:hypothetical protein